MLTESNHITLLAPAKINLGLEVLRRRDDGYHDLNTLFVAIDAGDDLTLTRRIDSRITCGVAGAPDIPTDERNLAVAALTRLRNALALDNGFHVTLVKRIPAGGGLGGGSSNAATALYAARLLIGPEFQSDEAISRIARDLGADIPFFLHGGVALGSGIGSELQYLPTPFPWYVLLVNPGVHVSTTWAYQALGRGLEYRPPRDLAAGLRQGIDQPKSMAATIINDFEETVFGRYPILRKIKQALTNAGALFSLMSGTGATVFGLFAELAEAERVRKKFAEYWTAVGSLIRW